jgi:hypothetical protein
VAKKPRGSTGFRLSWVQGLYHPLRWVFLTLPNSVFFGVVFILRQAFSRKPQRWPLRVPGLCSVSLVSSRKSNLFLLEALPRISMFFSHWPDLDHVTTSGPITVLKVMECSDEPGQPIRSVRLSLCTEKLVLNPSWWSIPIIPAV